MPVKHRAILVTPIAFSLIVCGGIFSPRRAVAEPVAGAASEPAEKNGGAQKEAASPASIAGQWLASLESGLESAVGAMAKPFSGAASGSEHYPWRTEIVTTTFWVGESATARNPVPNRASCWNPAWARDYGGSDEPDASRRSAKFIPASFTPRQNPFYFALPYNDVEHGCTKPEAAAAIPWFRGAFRRSGESVLKDRWIAIRYHGRVAYAQWEDAGPFRTDHWQYVFGNERPKKNLNKGAGLDVSPAVRDFLGMNDSDVTDWRFVDFSEVPGGPWARFGNNNTFVINARARGQKALVAAGLVR